MDGSLIRNFGFSYADTPITAMDEYYENIVFLSHPNHWHIPLKKKIRLLEVCC